MKNHISIHLLRQYQRQRKCLFFSERELKKALRDTREQRGRDSYLPR